MPRSPSSFLAPFAFGLLAASPAHALDSFEIQVYEAEVNAPGQLGLELHANYIVRGRTTAAYEGQIVDDGAARVTLEPALGITEFFELGMYLQGIGAPGHAFTFGGMKGRGKFVVPKAYALPFFLGLNVEVGKVPARIEENGWANEFRPVVGYRNAWLLVDANPIVGYALSGPDAFKPDFEPAGKLAINTQHGIELGVEYYASLGMFHSGFLPLARQEHIVFGTLDLAPAVAQGTPSESEWELNVGVGRGLTAGTGPEWLVKSIVGRAF